ncbi:MAG: exosortase U [Planctomycetota bacterium]|nr:exosortase U [Planctomycetota bacterium]
MSKTVFSGASEESDSIEIAEKRSAQFVMDSSAVSTLRLWLFSGLLLPLLGVAPLLYMQSRRLIGQQAFWYFPVSIALGVWLLCGTGSYRPASLNRGRVAVVLLWIGLATAAFGIYWYSPWVIHVASVVVLLAWSLAAFGGTAWTRVFAIGSLFMVTVPFPSGRDVQVSNWLQSISSWCCNGLLDVLGIPNIVEGDNMQIAESKFRVSVACAGLDSVFAFLAIGIAVIAIRRCSFLSGLITLLTIPFFAVFENILRLLVIAIGLVYFKADFSIGWLHAEVAVAVFLATVLSFWLAHKTIVAIFEPITRVTNRETEKSGLIDLYQKVTRWPVNVEGQLATGIGLSIWRPSWVSLSGPAAACLFFGAITFYSAMRITDNDALIVDIGEGKAALLPSDEAFPEQFGGLKKVDFRNITQPGMSTQGKYSRLWRFDDQGNKVFVSLDFPFPGWQPIWSLYQSNGWKILEIKPTEAPANSGPAWTAEEFKMQNQYGLYGYVWFAFFDENGIPINRKNDSEQLVRKNIFERLKNREMPVSQQTYQVQVFFESGKELSEVEAERNRKLFFAIFDQVRQQSQSALMKAK